MGLKEGTNVNSVEKDIGTKPCISEAIMEKNASLAQLPDTRTIMDLCRGLYCTDRENR